MGDRGDLTLAAEDIALIQRLKAHCSKMVVIMLSGRPLVVTDALADWNSFIAAWLPGTEGQGVADVLFGDVPFTGCLPHTWPRTVDRVPLSQSSKEPLWPFGFAWQG
jgi:beta-glucosidase